MMSPFSCRRSAIVSAFSVAIGIVSISDISVSLAYAPRAVPNANKGYVNNDVEHEEMQEYSPNSTNNRRGFINAGAAAILPFAMTVAAAAPANAFDNRKDDKYADAPQTPGKQPKDLGHSQRSNYVGLKECGTSPNCWNSSAPKANIPARWLPAWEANGRSIDDVKKVIDSYEVGHDDIDGGGFKVIEFSNKKDDQYLYVQFQSYRAGYIDDFECWFNPDSKKFDVRSSSRVGYSDLGVNAIRLDYIAARLEKEFGWSFERRRNGSLV